MCMRKRDKKDEGQGERRERKDRRETPINEGVR